MKPGILPNITEKKIYFADIGDLIDYRDDLDEAKDKLDLFFKRILVRISVENDVEREMYKEMTKEYERIDHLRRCVSKRLDVL